MRDIVNEYMNGTRDFTGANLRGANLHDAYLRGADLHDANLRSANLRYANLRDANLLYANLRHANLHNADLRGANLRGADLRDADLRDANLHDANLHNANLRDANLRDAERLVIQPLRVMLAVDGPIFAYKLLTGCLRGPYYPAGTHTLGSVHEVPDANTDEHEHCGTGLHVATFGWILREPILPDYVIAVVMHTAADIAAIPLTGGGKYRVRRYKVVSYLDRSKLSV